MKEWFKQLLHPEGEVSSKRLMGIIGALNIIGHSWYKPITGDDLKTHCLLIGGLLGVGAIVDVVKKGKGNDK
jgi:hypothetical protein